MNTEKEGIIEMYDTSFGKVVVVSTDRIYKSGEQVHIAGNDYTVKRILLPTRPDVTERYSLIVEQN